MSLVGIIKTIHGVTVFGDSKSSTLENGVFKANPSKPFVKKVFRGQNLIFSTSGCNQVFYNFQARNLDDVLEDQILSDSRLTPQIFMLRMQELFSDTHRDTETYFHVGYIAHNTCEAFTGILYSDGNYHINGYNSDCVASWSGYGDMVPKIFSIKREMTTDEVEEFIRNYMSHIIALGDLLLEYNPIGGDMQIESIRQ